MRCCVLGLLAWLALPGGPNAAAAEARRLEIVGDYPARRLGDDTYRHIEPLQDFRLRVSGPLSLVLAVRSSGAARTKLVVELDGRESKEVELDLTAGEQEIYLRIPAGSHRLKVMSLERIWLRPYLEQRRRLAVLLPRINADLDEATGETLNEALLDEFHQSGRLEVLGASDIAAMLRHQEQRTMFEGCTDNACLAEIGGALGARWIAETGIGEVGRRTLVTVKILDVSQAKVLARASETVAGSRADLVAAVRRAGDRALQAISGTRLVIKLGAEPAPTAAAPAAAVAVASEPMGLSGWGHVAFWSGLGALAFGGVAMGVSMQAAADFDEGDWSARGSSRTWAGVMWTGFGLGAALMVTGTVLWLVEPEQEAPATAVGAAPTAGGGGLLLGISGRF